MQSSSEVFTHPTPNGALIYHWHCGLLLLAETLILTRPMKAIAATLRIALREPYTIKVEDYTLQTRASLTGSKRNRKKVLAEHSDVALFYIPIEQPEYRGLRKWLGDRPVADLDIKLFEPVLPRLQEAFDGSMPGAEVKQLMLDTMGLISTSDTEPDALDPRVFKACEILKRTRLDEYSIESLADQVHLSPSRLRNLFREQIGQPIGDYARWTAIWQAAGYWKPGVTFTEAAVEAGFYDLAHATRVFIEVFGMPPSLVTDASHVKLICCD